MHSVSPSSTAARTVLCLSGPNLQLLGTREPEIYGHQTLAEIHESLEAHGRELGIAVDCRQTNREGELCDWIAECADASRGRGFVGILLNAGGYSHTSVALHDALKSVPAPCVEVHLSNPEARESFRHVSRIAGACIGKVTGFGANSYHLALVGLCAHLERSRASTR